MVQRRLVAIIPIALALAACAKVSIKRVKPDDYDTPGFRYYLPRPYMAVRKSFPVAGADILVFGEVFDNKVVRIDGSSLPSEIKDSTTFTPIAGDKYGISANDIIVREPSQKAGTPEATSDEKAKTPSKPTGEPKPKPSPSPSPSGSPTPSPSPSSPGTETQTKAETPGISAKVTTSGDPTTDPLKRVNDFFDVIYLPDMDQQYAVDVSAGFGTASSKIGLENGWMVEHAETEVDNRELGKFVFDNVTKLIDLAKEVGEAAIAPGAGSAVNLLKQVKTPPAGEQKSAIAPKESMAPAPVLLRIRYILEAEPGLYPVLKPTETATVAWKTAETEHNQKPSLHVLIPSGPFTVVAYNVRRTVVVELVNPTPPPPPATPVAKSGGGAGGKQGLDAATVKTIAAWLYKIKHEDLLDKIDTEKSELDDQTGQLTLALKVTSGELDGLSSELSKGLKESPLDGVKSVKLSASSSSGGE